MSTMFSIAHVSQSVFFTLMARAYDRVPDRKWISGQRWFVMSIEYWNNKCWKINGPHHVDEFKPCKIINLYGTVADLAQFPLSRLFDVVGNQEAQYAKTQLTSHIFLRQTWSSREGKLAVISLEEFIDRFEDTVRASNVLRHVFVHYFSRSWLIMFHMWHICGTQNCGTDSTCRYQTFVKMFSIFYTWS